MPTIRLDDPDPAALDGRHIRASAFELAQQELIDTLSRTPVGDDRRQPQPQPQALTIGAGYARLPQLLAGAGYWVTALDPSPEATAAARGRPGFDTSAVDYQVREHAELDEEADSFDLVWCIDTLETAPDPHQTLAEIARVTRPGGTIVLDTLNDTFLSRAIYLGLFQRFGLTRVMPAGRYRRDRFLTPAALTAACNDAGITINAIVGYEPGSPVALLKALLARRRGTIADSELADLARFRLSVPGHTPPVTYYAIATPRGDDD